MTYALPLVPNTAPGQDPFCILPWKHFEVRLRGDVYQCCKYLTPLTAEGGRPFSVTQDALDDIWNSEELRGIRREMAQGRLVPGCAFCYEPEAAGFPSLRTWSNQKWADGWLNEERQTPEQLKAQATADDYRHPAPELFELHLGNLCNLKCRMCYGSFSSRISRDPVHGRWAESVTIAPENRWWQNRKVFENLFRHPERIKHLYLVGGEPLLIKEVGDILRYLIDRDVAKNIVLDFSTNGTTTRAPWMPLTAQFKQVIMSVSMDGYGKLNDYMRYPSRWNTLVRNLDYYRSLPNVVVASGVVFQAYNALGAVELFRFFDSINLPFGVLVIDQPEYLCLQVLPPRVRQLAAQRLRAYAGRDCRPEYRGLMLSLASGLEAHGDAFDEQRLREFLLFTQDLDFSRGQSLCEACPELCELIAQSGFRTTAADLLAERKTLQARVQELEARCGELETSCHSLEASCEESRTAFDALYAQHEPLTYLSGLLREVGRQGVRKIKRSLS